MKAKLTPLERAQALFHILLALLALLELLDLHLLAELLALALAPLVLALLEMGDSGSAVASHRRGVSISLAK